MSRRRRRFHCLRLLGCLRCREARARTGARRPQVFGLGECDILLVGLGGVLIRKGELGVPLVLLLLLA